MTTAASVMHASLTGAPAMNNRASDTRRFAPDHHGLDIEMLAEAGLARRLRMRKGDHVYHAGQPFRAIYLIHSGTFKSCELTDDGREQVAGFRMRGDMVGLESIGLASYSCDVVALEDSDVWELPYAGLLRAEDTSPGLQLVLARTLAAELRDDRAWKLTLGTLGAESRVACFLLDLASRYAGMGFSARSFILRMSRLDMASFLALKHETISRILSHLQEAGCIAVQRREIQILDARLLSTLAAGETLAAAA